MSTNRVELPTTAFLGRGPIRRLQATSERWQAFATSYVRRLTTNRHMYILLRELLENLSIKKTVDVSLKSLKG